MAEICKKVQDALQLSVEWSLRNIVVPIYKCKSYIRNFSCHRAVKLYEHEMKIVEMVL